jgi:Domain of unknown function (DUF1995)
MFLYRWDNILDKMMHQVLITFIVLAATPCMVVSTAFASHQIVRDASKPSPKNRPSRVSTGMILDIFNGGKDVKKIPQLPRDVKDAVAKCREATQMALQDRVSRMDIEFPVGTRFGIEKSDSKKKKGKDVDNKPTKADFDRSDRELARILIEMFQPVGGNNIVVCFNDEEVATKARTQFGTDSTAVAQIVSMNRRKRVAKVKKTPSKGFAAKLAAEIEDELDESGPFRLPDNAEVALFVAPAPKELVIIERICDSVGFGTLIILLNARLASINNFGSGSGEALFRKEFQPVFTLTAASQNAAPGCLLYHVYGKNWILARKPKLGQTESLLETESRPTDQECRLVMEKLGLLGSEELSIVDSAVLSVTNWLR